MKSMSTLSKPIQIRLLDADNEALRQISATSAVPFSALVRLSVQYGLPRLKETLTPSKQAKQPA